jgi:hypothetical protein
MSASTKQQDLSELIGDAQIHTCRARKSKEATILLPILLPKIKFPYRWRYARIVQLTAEEKIAVNQIRHQGKKSYQKPCPLCGADSGCLKYRKISDGNSVLLCERCCKEYITSAIKLQQKMEERR